MRYKEGASRLRTPMNIVLKLETQLTKEEFEGGKVLPETYTVVIPKKENSDLVKIYEKIRRVINEE